MGVIRLEGHLICATAAEAAKVDKALPLHVMLTSAEPGCLDFVVSRTDDPLIWLVSESFADAAAFAAHQARTAASDWARETVGIKRDYQITEMPGDSEVR
jgi:quinol monooxygenase YgiN